MSDVKETYLSEFKAFSDNGASGVPGWLRAIRSQGIERFGRVGFPSTRDERWRFTDVARLSETPFTLANGEPTTKLSHSDLERHLIDSGAPYRLVFVNGQYAEELSRVAGVPSGVVMGTLAGAVEEEVEVAQRHLARYARPGDNPFTALSSAFIADGAFVYIPKGIVLEDHLEVVFLAVPECARAVAHPRNLVVVGDDAAVTIVESYIGLSDDVYWTNAVTEAVVGENARLETYRIQWESDQAYHTATTHSHQKGDSVYSLTTIALGSTLSRHDINAVLDGVGAECSLYGLSQLRGRQHVDHHTTIEHAQPHCHSWEYFNGIYDDRSRGVFTGRIIVRPGAQLTDSKQTNNNLLLSEQARADSQPQLEIYADDVKCTHGATLGPIDDRALFYLQSRGLDVEAARSLLTYGFGVEILNHIGIAQLRDRLDKALRTRLAEGASRRRMAV